MSNFDKVKEFTIASGFKCTKYATPMNLENVQFLINMVISEVIELAQTVSTNQKEAVKMIERAVEFNRNRKFRKSVNQAADQVDAVVDIWYYCLNACAKHNLNASKVFDIVHEANMNKRFPDGTFHIKNHKVIKPPGWKEPDIAKVLEI